VASAHDGDHRRSDRERLPIVTDIGLNRKQVHEARQIRDAEKRTPGMIQKALDAKLEAGEEPTRADVKRATQCGFSLAAGAITAATYISVMNELSPMPASMP
jgi:hypothetical protein